MLARIPFWGWFLIIMTGLYLVFNPLGVSLVHMWAMTDYSTLLTTGATVLPFKILATVSLLAILGTIVVGFFRSTSWVGLVTMCAIVFAVMWCLHSLIMFNLLNPAFWSWITQPLLAAIITLGWQWPKIWRRSHGTVTVEDPDTTSL